MCRLLLVIESRPNIAPSRVLQGCSYRGCLVPGDRPDFLGAFAIGKSTEP